MRTINHEGVAVEVLVEDRLFVARSAVPKEFVNTQHSNII